MTRLFHDNAEIQFDDVFAPNLSGTYAADSGFRGPDGSDLSRRYEHISFGSKHADVNHRTSAGVDVTNLWAAKGTAVYSLAFNGETYMALRSSSTGTVSATRSLRILNDGTWDVPGTGSLSGSPTSGTWLPAGQSVADWEVMFSVTSLNWDTPRTGTLTNSRPSYAAVGSGAVIEIAANAPIGPGSECSGTASIVCYLRRVSTGQVIQSSIILYASATGYV
jgi:hypothetical protein